MNGDTRAQATDLLNGIRERGGAIRYSFKERPTLAIQPRSAAPKDVMEQLRTVKWEAMEVFLERPLRVLTERLFSQEEHGQTHSPQYESDLTTYGRRLMEYKLFQKAREHEARQGGQG